MVASVSALLLQKEALCLPTCPRGEVHMPARGCWQSPGGGR